jgi:hypothetical protein
VRVNRGKRASPIIGIELALAVEQLKAQAKECQKEHGHTAPGRRKSLPPILEEVIQPPKASRKTSAVLAKQAGVSRATFCEVERLKRDAREATTRRRDRRCWLLAECGKRR